MKKRMFLILGMLGILLLTPFHAAARASEADAPSHQFAAIQVDGNKVSVPFSELGYREKTLLSPYGVTSVFLNTPLNWKLIPGGEIELHYDVLLSGADIDKIVDAKNPFGGSMLFTFNGQLVGSLPLDETGSHIARLKIPDTALTSILADGRNQLTISLDAPFSCNYDIKARVVIKSTSFFDLVFEVSSPELNLSRLPSPFYRNNSFIPDSALIVVPDSPDVLEIQAALNVMAGFGSMIGNDYNMELITISQLAGVDPTLHHMIFVGMPGQFNILSEVQFQIPIANGKFVNIPPTSEGDGIVELALSPWNPSKVIMVVSGNSIEAVVKAGQAVSSGRIFIYENPTLAFVSNVQMLSETLPVIEDSTFENLGYITQTLSGVGVKSHEYLFYASKEQVSTKDGYVELVYYHSGLLDYGVSSFSVSINGQVIASEPFSEKSEEVTTIKVKIPSGTLRFGENRLDVRASMIVLTACDSSGFSDPWLTISSQSNVHLPAAAGTALAEPLLKDLKFFPELFVTHSDLGDVAFVFPKSDTASWKIAGKLAYNLGRQFNPLIANLQVAYADDVPQGIHDTRSLIVLGLASEIPFLGEFNDLLPAPFDLTNNTASERQMQIVYRIPEGVSVGYLELMLSPFNVERSILVVSGNNHNGLLLAGNGLLQTELSSQLAGVFAVTNGTLVATGNASSPFSIVGEVAPGSVAVNTTPVSNVLDTKYEIERPGWLLPVIIISILSVVGILGYVIVTTIAKNRLQRIEVLDEVSIGKSGEKRK